MFTGENQIVGFNYQMCTTPLTGPYSKKNYPTRSLSPIPPSTPTHPTLFPEPIPRTHSLPSPSHSTSLLNLVSCPHPLPIQTLFPNHIPHPHPIHQSCLTKHLPIWFDTLWIKNKQVEPPSSPKKKIGSNSTDKCLNHQLGTVHYW